MPFLYIGLSLPTPNLPLRSCDCMEPKHFLEQAMAVSLRIGGTRNFALQFWQVIQMFALFQPPVFLPLAELRQEIEQNICRLLVASNFCWQVMHRFNTRTLQG